LQDAYVAETGVNIGDWKAIGYNMASSPSFNYAEPDGFTDHTVALSAGMNLAWKATAVAALNDCAANSVWSLNVSQNGATGGSAVYHVNISSDDCQTLTPNFKRLNTSGTAATIGGN
jgi:hypothetical protein